MPAKNKRKGKKRAVRKKRPRSYWGVVALLLGMCGLVGVGLYLGYTTVRSNLPPIFSFRDYQESSVQMSKVLASDGTTVGTFYDERRSVVPLQVISPWIQEAVLTAEDRDFYTHGGLDFLSIARALWKDVLAGSYVQGGSTITQQVAKTFYLSAEKTIARKLREAVLAYALEQELTKQDIFALYLNQIYLGHGRYGVAEATRFYFGKEPQAVTVAEAASLAALIRSPERLSPFKHPEKNKVIRDRILEGMAQLGALDPDGLQAALKEPITEKAMNSDSPQWAAYYVDAVRRELEKELSPSVLRKGGYRIHTEMNADAQESIALRLKSKEVESRLKSLQCAFVMVDSITGGVQVLQGGKDFRDSSFNRAVQSRRSIGSIVKPFLFGYALSAGSIERSDVFINERTEYPVEGQPPWSPRNFDGKYDGNEWSLDDALVFSINTISAQVLKAVGVKEFSSFLKRLFPKSDVGDYWANSLGAFGASPLAVARAFSLFPSGGIVRQPTLIRRVLARDGRNVWRSPERPRRLMNGEVVTELGGMMEDVVLRGTGRNAAITGVTVRGKTGTSNGFVDSWFAGYVGTNVAVFWAGRDNNSRLAQGGGGALAAPVWSLLMRETLNAP